MATEPYNPVPSVEPQTTVPPDVYRRLDIRPEQFGGLIARGEEQLGQGLERASQNAFDVAQFAGKVNADDQVNHWITARDSILTGDPTKPRTGADGAPILGPNGQPMPDTGYFGLEGRAASDQRQATLKALQDAREAGRSNLKSPQEQFEYDVQTRRMYADAERQIGVHADQQWKVWAGGVNETGAGQAMDAYLRNLDTPEVRDHHAADYINFRVQAAQMKYGDDPNIKSQVIADAKKDLVKAQIEQVGVNEPARARAIAERPEVKALLGKEYDGISLRLKQRADQQIGNSYGGQAFAAADSAHPYANASLSIWNQTSSAIPGGFSPNGLARTIKIESGGNPNAATGHAVGLGQFMPATWDQFGQGDRRDPVQSIAATQRYAAANAQTLSAALGRAPTDAELYLAHQQGPSGAEKLLLNPNARAGSLVGDAAIRQNGGDPNAPAWMFTNMWVAKFNGAGGWSTQQGLARPGALPEGQFSRKATAYQLIEEARDNGTLTDEQFDHAVTRINRLAAEQEIADNQTAKARTEAINAAVGNYTTEYWNMLHTPNPNWVELAGRINRDPVLADAGPAKDGLMDRIVKRSGAEQSLTFGPGYNEVKDRILSDPGSPGHIGDITDIYKLPIGQLTATGEHELITMMENVKRRGADEYGIQKTRADLENYAKSVMAKEQIVPGMGAISVNKRGLEIYEAEFMPQWNAAYANWIKAGKDPYEFLNHKHIDEMIDRIYPPGRRNADNMQATGEVAPPEAPNAPLPLAPEGVDQKAWMGLISAPPVMANGNVATHKQYADAIAILREDPSPDIRAKFNKSFGTQGAMADDVLQKLTGVPESKQAASQESPGEVLATGVVPVKEGPSLLEQIPQTLLPPEFRKQSVQ